MYKLLKNNIIHRIFRYFFYFFLWQFFGTTQGPLARQPTIGSGKTSAAEAEISERGTITFRASNAILRDELPIWVISPTASM
jgi:hypothetical protein